MPAPHPPDFRQRAVELARLGEKPVAELAKSLGISESCLRNWMVQTDIDENGHATKPTSAEKKELAELRKRAPTAGDGKRDTQARRRVFRQGEHSSKQGSGWSMNSPLTDSMSVTCRLLQVSSSGYYDWRDRLPSPRELRNRDLTKMIHEIHAESRGSYGWPRVHAELTLGLGEPVNHKRVERLMREAGLQGIYRRKQRRMPVGEATEDDLVHRHFTVEAPDRLWCTDITEHPTHEGKLYCPPYSMRIHAASSAGLSETSKRPNSSQTRSAWRSCAVKLSQTQPFYTPITERNIRRGRSGNAFEKLGCLAPWAPSAIATTIR